MIIIIFHYDHILSQRLPFAFCCLWRSSFGHKFPIFSYSSPSYQGDADDNDDDHDNDNDNDDDDDDIINKWSSFGHTFPIFSNCSPSYQGDDDHDYDDTRALFYHFQMGRNRSKSICICI